MGKDTYIEWCDSTANPEVGCDGCELWTKRPVVNPQTGIEELIRTCYAGNLVTRYAGLPGWPDSFAQPKLFLDRLLKIERWRDLTGTDREAKPWLNGLPRLIFLNDLGDTFTASLPLDWLAQPSDELQGRTALQVLAGCKAIILLLTKRPDRMRQFFEKHPCPGNFMPMTSVTGPDTVNRVRELLKIKACWHGISAEPLLHDGAGKWHRRLTEYLPVLDWVITGGESGAGKRDYSLQAFRELRDECESMGTNFFMKQLDKVNKIPTDLFIRQMPKFRLIPDIRKEV